MDPTLDHQDLEPPQRQRVILRGLPIAIVAHVLFAVALASSLDWKREPDPAMAAVPLPPATATVPADATQSMGAAPAPSAPQPATPRSKEQVRRSR